MDYILIGRCMVTAGAGLLSIVFLFSMRLTTSHILLWSQAMLALVFSFTTFTQLAALAMHVPSTELMGYFLIANGAVHLSTALVAIGIVWGLSRK